MMIRKSDTEFLSFCKGPDLTQRQMAEQMGISLGKFNYCLKELAQKGLAKINRFKASYN